MFSPLLHRLLAEAHADDLRESAVQVQRKPPQLPLRRLAPDAVVTLRFGFPDDAEAVARLAALDSAAPPPLPLLLAEVAGELRAAISLADGSVIAHPFHPTAPLVSLLRTRADQLRGSEDRAHWRWLRGRLGLPAWR